MLSFVKEILEEIECILFAIFLLGVFVAIICAMMKIETWWRARKVRRMEARMADHITAATIVDRSTYLGFWERMKAEAVKLEADRRAKFNLLGLTNITVASHVVPRFVPSSDGSSNCCVPFVSDTCFLHMHTYWMKRFARTDSVYPNTIYYA